jgi:hypothetical protein
MMGGRLPDKLGDDFLAGLVVLVSSDLACFGFFCADWPV